MNRCRHRLPPTRYSGAWGARLLTAILVAWSPALALCAARSGEPARIGPFFVGMPFEAARAATPGIEWRDSRVSGYTGRVLAIAADGAFTLGGLLHSVELAPGFRGAYTASFAHAQAVEDAPACERLVVPVIVELERTFGRFKPTPAYGEQVQTSPGRLNWTTQRMPSGALVVTPTPGAGPTFAFSHPFDTVKMGAKSAMAFQTDGQRHRREDASPDPLTRVGVAKYRRRDTQVRVEALYRRQHGRLDDRQNGRQNDERTCLLTTELSREGAPRRSEDLELTAANLLRAPSIADRHHSLDQQVLPSHAMTITLACTVDRPTGLLDCRADRDAQNAWALLLAAEDRARAYRVDPRVTNPDDTLPLHTTLSITLAAEDRRPLDFASRPALPMTEVLWARVPDEAEHQTLIERGAFAGLAGARFAIKCEIQPDHSLICAAIPPGGSLDGLAEPLIVKSLLGYVAAPRLRSGAPSAGAVVATVVEIDKPWRAEGPPQPARSEL